MVGKNNNLDELSRNIDREFGKILSHPAPGEEIVISGLSGRYPECNNVQEFRDNLFSKKNMVTDVDLLWKSFHPDVPPRIGKVPNVNRFDAGFFGIHRRKATQMDSQLRLFLEVAFEAILDAGLHPSELEGTNTGVFVGNSNIENVNTWLHEKLEPQGFAVIGNGSSMITNHISSFLKLKGPSYTCDTACSSSLYALETAYKAIRIGLCDKAIVGGTHLCTTPYLSLQFAKLGVLSPDGVCKVFDASGNGYVRSETVSAIVLQKSKEAKRTYTTLLHAKTNCDGYKDSGLLFPSSEMQIQLFKEFYEECCFIKPNELSFLEAHGTGTKVGDPEEVNAIDSIFTKGRSSPLLIGSTKSNVGHSEPSSAMCSITKVIIAAETGFIPPNIHFETPRPELKGIIDGRLKVVVDQMPFDDNNGLLGVNGFGFGGANCHVLLKQNPKEKENNGRAKDNIPRLVCVSGRTHEAVDSLLDDVIANNADVEHIRLLHEIFRENIKQHWFRGYSLISKSGEICRSVNQNTNRRSNLLLCFGDIERHTIENAAEFLELPIAATTLPRIHEVLVPKGINIQKILSNSHYSSVLDTVLATFTLRILLAGIIKACDIKPDQIFGITEGFSLGTLVCGYFEDAITLEEATECAYQIASIAHSANCTDCNDTAITALIEQKEKTATSLQQAVRSILQKPSQLRKKVILGGNPAEISPATLENGVSIVGVLGDLKSVFGKHFVLLEIGNGELGQIRSQYLGHNDKNLYIKSDGGINSLLSSLGRLYEVGYNPQFQNVYPKIEFPVSRGTPMISPKIKWRHDRSWWVTFFTDDLHNVEQNNISVIEDDSEISFTAGHVIDGRNLIPATGYLWFIWKTLAKIYEFVPSQMKVIFENCKFKRAAAMPKQNQAMTLTAMIQRGNGNFEITEGGTTLVSGRVYYVSNETLLLDALPTPCGVNKDKALYMSMKDVYKELRLRGYNYRDQFKGIQSCDTSAEVSNVIWNGNWVTFMDNMLQMKILQTDSRLLYVPTSIRRLVIDAKAHIEYAKSIGGDNESVSLPVYAARDCDLIRSGGIEIRGLNATSIPRRKYLGIPVIEKYVFVPNETSLKTEQAVRVNLQIILENAPSITFKVVELIDEATPAEMLSLAESIYDVLGDQPLIQPDIIILSKAELDIKNVKVEDKELVTETECNLVVGSRILQRRNVLQLTLGSIKANGFVLSREPLHFEYDPSVNKDVNIITVFTTEQEKLILFRKSTSAKVSTVVQVSENTTFTWVPLLQKAMAKDGKLVVYSQGDPLSGNLGLISCIRREPGGQDVRLAFIQDTAPEFDVNLPFYDEQLKKNLAINIFKDNKWGTYRHLLLDPPSQIETEYCYLNNLRRGDLSSLTWLEAPSSMKKRDSECHSIHVHYASLNFKDIMLATGKINVDSATRDRREQECVQGFEFSGINHRGERVMGLVSNGSTASILIVDNALCWKVPDKWTLEEAASVPVVYITTILGLVYTAKVKRGESVLIHSGTGGVGLAAIQLALHIGCTVYTTVGTPEKRTFLKEQFPQLKDHHISNSRTTEFEKHVMKQTNGRGVDVVLNSLAEEKLFASVRCLARGGRFVEIGKYDLANDNVLNLLLLEKGASFHVVMADLMITNPQMVIYLQTILEEFISGGIVRPLPITIFKMNEAEAAFRFMTTGKHMGKVMIEIRKEQNAIVPMQFPCKLRYYCDCNKTYIICGGLGGFGLEFADWLILRGCKNLVLSSRFGIKTGYQAYRIGLWRSYGCTIKISTDDITTYEGCLNMIKTSNELAPVHAIFNLAVILKDAIFENQTEDSFRTSFGPKANATQHLDRIARELCPELRDFVVFSSVSCGRGNAGQSNYGMSNSVMERICEKRRSEGLPALAIEWGAVGDVGLVADMQEDAIEMEIGGTLQQSITSCLEAMDIFLRQSDAAVVSSIVVAEKRSGMGGANNIVDAVANILGVKDLKQISLQATLAEIGMDSMTAVEIKQTLEREFEVSLTPQDIKGMTFERLIQIQAEIDAEGETALTRKQAVTGMDMIIGIMPDESDFNSLIMPIAEKLNVTAYNSTVVLFPGIEGTSKVLEPLYTNLRANLLGLQFTNNRQMDTIEEMTEIFIPIIEEKLSKEKPFKIVCHSFGTSVALETAKILEQKGYYGTIICLDGAPNYLKALAKLLEVESEDKFQVSLIVHIVTLVFPYEMISKHIEALMKCSTFEERLKLTESVVPPSPIHTMKYIREYVISVYKRLKAFIEWTPEFKLKSKIVLFKPSVVSIEAPDEISGLSALCEDPIEVRTFKGDHLSFIQNSEMAQGINEIFGLV